jgi:hypothetical protein
MQMNFLNMAMLYIPTQHDAERPKQYFPRNPYPVNSAYPTTPAPIFETPAIFEKLGTDTLFFIFYYQQGTYQQVRPTHHLLIVKGLLTLRCPLKFVHGLWEGQRSDEAWCAFDMMSSTWRPRS